MPPAARRSRHEGGRLRERRARGASTCPSPSRAEGQVLHRACCAAASAGPTCTPATTATQRAEMAARGGLRPVHALRPAGRLRPRVLRRGRRATVRGAGGRSPTGTPVVALPLLRRGAASTRSACRPRRPAPTPSRCVVEESLMMPVPERPRGRARRADRADGGRLARRAPRRGAEGRRGDRDRLRAGRAGRDLHAEGAGACARSWRATSRPGAARSPRACGADVVVDPTEGSPYAAAGDQGHLTTMPAAARAGASGRWRSSSGCPFGGTTSGGAAEGLGVEAQAPGDLRVRRRARR